LADQAICHRVSVGLQHAAIVAPAPKGRKSRHNVEDGDERADRYVMRHKAHGPVSVRTRGEHDECTEQGGKFDGQKDNSEDKAFYEGRASG